MFEALDRISSSSDWLTIVLMIVLVLIAVLQYNFSDRFYKLFSLAYSEKYYTDFSKSRPLIFNIFHVFFFAVISFNISLLIFFTFKTFKPTVVQDGLQSFGQLLLFTSTYIALRYGLGRLLAFVFDLNEGQSYFTFLKISNLALVSVLLFPFLVLTAYSVGFFHKFLITFTLVAFLLTSLIFYFVLIKNERLDFNNLFYLFLYLCALEIAPFIVIYKMFVD